MKESEIQLLEELYKKDLPLNDYPAEDIEELKTLGYIKQYFDSEVGKEKIGITRGGSLLVETGKKIGYRC